MDRSWGFAVIAAVATLSSLYYLGSSILDDSVDDFRPSFDRDYGTLSRPSILSLVELTESEAPEEYPALHSGEFKTADYSKIVVIPDIHGDAKNFIISLWIAVQDVEKSTLTLESFERIINAAAAEGVYPDTPLFPDSENIAVSLGDLVDRGPDSVLCLRILWSIEKVIGWPLVSLYGNHEIMSHSAYADNYINRKEIYELGSIRARNKIFDRSSPLWKKMASSGLLMGRFVDSHAFPKPHSLPSKKSVLFNHAGPEPNFIDSVPEHVAESIHLMNQMAQIAVTSNDTSGDMWLKLLMNNEQSPVWSRVLTDDQMDQRILCGQILPVVLERFGVGRLVLGHTPQYDHRMKALCGGRIILADCAISRYMADDDGQPAVLVMSNSPAGSPDFNEIYALYYSFTSGTSYKEPLVKPAAGAFQISTSRPSAMRRSPRMTIIKEDVETIEDMVPPVLELPSPSKNQDGEIVIPSPIKPGSSSSNNTSPVGVEETWSVDEYLEAMASIIRDKDDPTRLTGWFTGDDDHSEQ